MADDEEGVPEYDLVMPFVVVESNGGPYADEPFVAGYRMGMLDAVLEFLEPEEHTAYLEPGVVAQADLIAMRHNYVMTATPHDADWSFARFVRTTED